MQQYLQYFQRIRQARTNSKQRHTQFLRTIAGATYRHELGQHQVEERLDISDRQTMHVAAVVKPSGHMQERHTDKYNLRELPLTDLLDHAIIRHARKHHELPLSLSLSRTNIYLLMLQDICTKYRNASGEYWLYANERLDNNTIICD